MIAVLKKELVSAFSRFYGYGIIAILSLGFGVQFFLFNLIYTAESTVTSTSYSSIIAVFLIPLLAVFAFPNRKRNNTDMVYRLLPVNSWDVVIGKYLALLTLIMIPNVLALVLPLVAGFFSVQNHAQSYASIFALMLFECAWLAVCMFISRLINSRWIAGVVCCAVGILWLFSLPLAFFIPQTPLASLIAFSVAFALIAVALYFVTKRLVFSAVVPLVLEMAVLAGFFLSPSALDGLFTEVVESLSIFNSFDVFVAGIFDLKGILLFLVVSVLFVFLTWRLQEIGNAKPSPMKFSVKKATSLLLALILVTSSLVLCVSASFVPNTLTSFDATSSEKNSVSDQAKEFLSLVDKDVTIYLLGSTGLGDYEFYLESFAAASDRITLKKASYSSDPQIYSQFGIKKEDVLRGLVSNDLVLECGEKVLYVTHDELFIYFNETLYSYYGLETLTYEELSYYTSQFQSLGVSEEVISELLNSSIPLYFNADKLLCTYIEYLIADIIPTPYYLVGHGEKLLSDTSNPYGKLNIPELKIDGSIPADASCILINMPAEDISEAEAGILLDYLKNGGQITFVTSSENLDMPNLCSVLAAYGLTARKEIVNVLENTEKDEEDTEDSEANAKEDKTEGTENDETVSEGSQESAHPIITDSFVPTIDTQNNDIFYKIESYNQFEVTLKKANPIVFDKDAVTAADTVTALPVIISPKGSFLGENTEDTACYTVAYALDTPEGTKIVWFTGGESYNSITESTSELVLMAMEWVTLEFESVTGNIPPVIYSQIPVVIESFIAPIIGFSLVIIPLALLSYGIIKYRLAIRKRIK